jgi:hypothetical protein
MTTIPYRLHEWPLVAFTALAVAGAGMIFSPAVAAALGLEWTAVPRLVPAGGVLLGAGMIVSLVHLGRPRRAPLALAAAGRSVLSAEVLLAGATLAGAMWASVVPRSLPANFAASSLAVAFLVSVGLVYNLRGHYWWRGLAAVAPLNLGATLAALAIAASLPLHRSPATPAVLVLAGTDAILFVARLVRHSRIPRPFRRRHPALFAPTLPLVASRLALANLLPVLLVLGGRPGPATAALALGILVDRFAFYALSAQHTTEVEIAVVEEELIPPPSC